MSLWPCGVIGLLTAVNALYVAAEFAAVALPRSELTPWVRAGNRRASALLEILQDGVALDRYIAACQVGITLSSLVAGAYAQATIAYSLAAVLQRSFDWEAFTSHSSAAVIVLVVLTLLQVVLGELVPKSLALQFPVRTALLTFGPLRWSMSIYRAFIWLLNGSGNLLLRPFGVTPGGQPHVHSHSPEELALLFAESQRGGTLSPEVHRRLKQVLRLSRRTVRQLMAPRSQLIAIEASMPDAEIIRRVLDSPYSRLPVYRETIDQLLGSVNTKDIVASFLATGSVPPLVKLMRPMPCVPGNLRADRLVRLLREERTSKAMVVDEFGGVQGLISIDDLLTEVFGDLGDELKASDRPQVELLPDGRVKLPGWMRPSSAEPWLGDAWQGNAATLGGLVVSNLGHMPVAGEQIELSGAEVTVLEVTPTTVVSIAVRPRARKPDAEKEHP